MNPSNALTGDHNAGSSSWSSGSSRHPYGYHATAPSGPDDLERQSAPPAPLPQGAAPASLLMPPHMPPPSIPAAPAAVSASAPPKSVLLVGNPGLPLKGFDTAVRVLVAASCLLPVTVTWVCQQLPSPLTVPSLFTLGAGLSIRYFVSPSQADIPRLYRGHDALLFTSRYEAWGLPVMEALASGLAVVTTDCLGVKSFARHGANCLMARPDDVAGLVMQLVAVLSDGALRGALQAAARATALQFTPDAVTDRLESLLYGLTACSSELMQARQQCAADIHATCAWASQACSGNR